MANQASPTDVRAKAVQDIIAPVQGFRWREPPLLKVTLDGAAEKIRDGSFKSIQRDVIGPLSTQIRDEAG